MEDKLKIDYNGIIYYLGVRGLLAGFLAGSAHLAILTYLRVRFGEQLN